MLAGDILPSASTGFTYSLQQRRRVVLAGNSTRIYQTMSRIHLLPTAAKTAVLVEYTPSRLDSLTSYSSEVGQC